VAVAVARISAPSSQRIIPKVKLYYIEWIVECSLWRLKMNRNFTTNAIKSGAVDISSTVPVLNVEELLNGSREVRLMHCSEEYRLMITKNNKLILTK
jgi:hemin uptake protein HemP